MPSQKSISRMIPACPEKSGVMKVVIGGAIGALAGFVLFLVSSTVGSG
ncbi:MAG: hypothetical protein ACP5M0_10745 [Desulfomonilaceae bacterium]